MSTFSMPLFGRKQTEGEQHHPSFHAELVLEISGIDEAHVGNAMGDEIDLRRRRLVNLLQHVASALGHDDEPGRECD